MKSDKMSMAASLELRCPFLDVEVAEIARRIPPSLRLRGSFAGKLVVRECLRRRIGEAPILPKKGFPIPLDDWLRGPLREVVRDSVFSRNSEATAQLDPQLLGDAWAAFLAGEPLGNVFYALWLYEAWRSALRLRSPEPKNHPVRLSDASSIAIHARDSEEPASPPGSADPRQSAV
jgi:asparagine synthase (glutamine-hydrolysing)